MILCGNRTAEKQTEHDHTQSAVASVIAMFQRHTFFSFWIRIDLKRLSHLRSLPTGLTMHHDDGQYLPARLALLPAARYYVTHLTKRPGAFAQSPGNRVGAEW